ncbi:MAG: hypothetical protein ACK4ST_02550 [Elioraea tepidiphila]
MTEIDTSAEALYAARPQHQGWREFDPSDLPDGLCWVEVERPETWCDAGDDGRTVGGYTDKSARLMVLVEAYRTDAGVAFERVGYGEHGEVRRDDTVRRWMPLITPAEVEAREAAAAEAMRAACADYCHGRTSSRSYGSWADAFEAAERGIRALPLPDADALTRALAQARADEREVCAVLAVRLGTFIDPDDGPVTRPLAEEIADAIRARGKETKA